jgi:hypothetical protein
LEEPCELESDQPRRRPGGGGRGRRMWALVPPFWLRTAPLPSRRRGLALPQE